MLWGSDTLIFWCHDDMLGSHNAIKTMCLDDCISWFHGHMIFSSLQKTASFERDWPNSARWQDCRCGNNRHILHSKIYTPKKSDRLVLTPHLNGLVKNVKVSKISRVTWHFRVASMLLFFEKGRVFQKPFYCGLRHTERPSDVDGIRCTEVVWQSVEEFGLSFVKIAG